MQIFKQLFCNKFSGIERIKCCPQQAPYSHVPEPNRQNFAISK